MEEYITADKLDHMGQVIKFAFSVLHPNGLTINELAESDQQWHKMIHKSLKEGQQWEK